MNVRLPAPLEEFARRKVEQGDFESVEEVVCEALRLLQQQDEWNAEAAAKIEVGWNQAKSGQLRTSEQVRESLRFRKGAWSRAR